MRGQHHSRSQSIQDDLLNRFHDLRGHLTRRWQVIQDAVQNHVREPLLLEMLTKTPPPVTSTHRGVNSGQENLLIALDILCNYQRESAQRHFFQQMDEPRLRLVEILKAWLRQEAAKENVEEDTLKRMSKVCITVLRSREELFKSHQKVSIARALTGVYDEVQVQLTRTIASQDFCSRHMKDTADSCRRFLSCVIAVLLVGPTNLIETDNLESLEPGMLRNASVRQDLKRLWETDCGKLLLALARMHDDAGSKHDDVLELLDAMRTKFDGTPEANTGLAGPFRSAEQHQTRRHYLSAAKLAFELSYLRGAVLHHFHSITQDYGDYGAIRMAKILHPILHVLKEKVRCLKEELLALHERIEYELYLAPVRNRVEQKWLKKGGRDRPTSKMRERCQEKMEEAVSGNDNFADRVVRITGDLVDHSKSSRLPELAANLGTDCHALIDAINSDQFQCCMGDHALVRDLRDAANMLRTSKLPVPTGSTRSIQLGSGFSLSVNLVGDQAFAAQAVPPLRNS